MKKIIRTEVDEELWRRVRSQALLLGKNAKEIVEEALKLWESQTRTNAPIVDNCRNEDVKGR